MNLFGSGTQPRPSFIYGNIVFGRDLSDAWGMYRLHPQSYSGLSTARKIEVMERLNGFVQRSQADFQILRVARTWSIEEYLASTWRTFDARHGSVEELERRKGQFEALLHTHAQVMEDRSVTRPDIYLAVRLQEARVGLADFVPRWSASEMARNLGAAVGLRDARGLRYGELTELERIERRTYERVFDFLDCQRALASEVCRLVRRSYVRGLGEPVVDENFQPQAVAITSEAGEEVGFEPYQWDLLRLHSDYRVRIGARHLEIESEQGTSYQSLLVCGALPEEREFPGQEAELLFAPVDVEFPVDACLSCSYLPNADAQRLARKRMLDADQMWKEEAGSDHGASADAEERPSEARALQRRLGAEDQPPLLRSTITYALASSVGLEELEERQERFRSRFGQRIQLHRPIAAQHQIFLSMMPAQRFPLKAYCEHLLPEEVAAMVPTAVDHAGSEIGLYIGHTLSASRQPIRFDAAEASQQARTPTVMLTGGLGSGKTNALELFQYHMFLQGSAPIVDIDPGGTPESPDHKLHLIPEMAAEMERIVLSADPQYQGLIDPLRVAGEDNKADIAFGFVLELLPEPVPPLWQTEIRAAIDFLCASPERDQVLGEVVALLEAGSEAAQEAGRAMAVHINTGLAKLAFGIPGAEIPEVGSKRVITFQIKNLTLPRADTARSEMSREERLGTALLSLLAGYALRLTTSDPDRHASLSMDEAWVLFKNAAGRALLEGVARKGRRQNVTPILATQIVSDAEELRGLIATFLCLGVDDQAGAEESLKLVGLDHEDEALIQRQMSFRKGRGIFRDFNGQAVAMQIDLADPLLLARWNTTPPPVRGRDATDETAAIGV